MKSPEKISIIVPVDVVMDISQIMLQAGIAHSIEDVKPAKNALVFELQLLPHHKQAKKNIFDILSEYNFYRYGTAT